jgi:hypothetical protein
VTPDELAAILDPTGARPAPYWPASPPPPGYAPSWKQKDAYEARLAVEHENGGLPDPRIESWRAYDREVRECWSRRMALAEQAVRRGAR